VGYDLSHRFDPAVTALILVEECKLRLDDSIEPWLPELTSRVEEALERVGKHIIVQVRDENELTSQT
jgi:hypothetical protein